MDRRTMTSLGLGVMLAACATGALHRSSVDSPAVVEALGPGVTGSVVRGIVRDSQSGEALEGALVILQCDCLAGQREVQTDANGVYNFRRLPAGEYTVQVLYGQAIVNRSHALAPATGVRLDFRLRADQKFIVT